MEVLVSLDLPERKLGNMMVIDNVGLRYDGTLSFFNFPERYIFIKDRFDAADFDKADFNKFINICEIIIWNQSIVGLNLDGSIRVITKRGHKEEMETFETNINKLNKLCKFVQIYILKDELWALGENGHIYILAELKKVRSNSPQYTISESQYTDVVKIGKNVVNENRLYEKKQFALLTRGGRVILSDKFLNDFYIKKEDAVLYRKQVGLLEGIIDLAVGDELGPILFAIDKHRQLIKIGGGKGSDLFHGKYEEMLVDKIWAGSATHVCKLIDGSLISGGRAYDQIVKNLNINLVYCYNRYEKYIAVADDGSVHFGSQLSNLKKIDWNLK